MPEPKHLSKTSSELTNDPLYEESFFKDFGSSLRRDVDDPNIYSGTTGLKFIIENLYKALVLGRNFCDQKTFLKISKSSEMKEFIARNRIQRSLPQVKYFNKYETHVLLSHFLFMKCNFVTCYEVLFTVNEIGQYLKGFIHKVSVESQRTTSTNLQQMTTDLGDMLNNYKNYITTLSDSQKTLVDGTIKVQAEATEAIMHLRSLMTDLKLTTGNIKKLVSTSRTGPPIRSTIPLISSRNIASPVQRPSPPPEDPLRITLYYKNFTLRFNQQKSRPKLDLTQTTKGKSRYFTRKFKKEIYEKNDWICGCSVTNSLFCFPCLLFGRGVAEPSWSNTGVTDLSHLAQKIRNMRMLKLISILS
nr:unnamed protein product [Callosobruchus chinensis]